MKPEIWGPFMWHFIHFVAFGIPNDDYFKEHKNSYINFYECLRSIIPCPICRNHYKSLLKNNSLRKCNTKNEMIEWTINKHNSVNRDNGKKELDVKDAINLYKNGFNLTMIFTALDILTFNTQRRAPMDGYRILFESLRIIYPIPHIRIAMIEAMSEIDIKVSNYDDLFNWYRTLGKKIAFKIKN